MTLKRRWVSKLRRQWTYLPYDGENDDAKAKNLFGNVEEARDAGEASQRR